MTPDDARGDYSSIRLSHADSFLFELPVIVAPDYDWAILNAIIDVIIIACGPSSYGG